MYSVCIGELWHWVGLMMLWSFIGRCNKWVSLISGVGSAIHCDLAGQENVRGLRVHVVRELSIDRLTGQLDGIVLFKEEPFLTSLLFYLVADWVNKYCYLDFEMAFILSSLSNFSMDLLLVWLSEVQGFKYGIFIVNEKLKNFRRYFTYRYFVLTQDQNQMRQKSQDVCLKFIHKYFQISIKNIFVAERFS